MYVLEHIVLQPELTHLGGEIKKVDDLPWVIKVHETRELKSLFYCLDIMIILKQSKSPAQETKATCCLAAGK